MNEAGRSAAPLLATARLYLRPFATADADQLHRLFLDASVRRYLLDDELVSAQWVADEIDGSDALFAERGVGLWSIVLIGETDVIGFAGFRFFHDPPELQLIYGLHPRHWGVGLATEAAWAIIEHAFARAGLDEIVASADTPNVASIEVMKRLGMSFHRRLEKGGLDTTYYRLRRGEFPPRQS